MLDWMADMKRMGRNGLVVAAASALAIWGSAAQASVLHATYTFGDGYLLDITAEGTLRSDANKTFTVSQVDQVTGNGVSFFSSPSQILLLSNTLSLTGFGISFDVQNTLGTTLVDLENYGTIYSGLQAATAYTSIINYHSESFSTGSYSANLVPEPATAGLLGVLLVGFGVARRFRQS